MATDPPKPKTTALIPAATRGGLAVGTPRRADQNPVLRYLARLAEGDGRRTMGEALDVIAEILTGQPCPAGPDRGPPGHFAARFPFEGVDRAHFAFVRDRLMKRYQPATVRKQLAALRGVLRAAFEDELIDEDAYRRAISPPRNPDEVPRDTEPAGRMLSNDELAALARVAASEPRDRVILTLLALGLRRAEAAKLTVGDVNLDEAVLRFRGKRKKKREVPLSAEDVEVLRGWMVGHSASDAVLGIGPGRVYKRLKSMAKRAGLKALPSPHDFRRTLISRLLDLGDAAAAQRIAGHSRLETTLRYDRRGLAASRKAMERLKAKTDG